MKKQSAALAVPASPNWHDLLSLHPLPLQAKQRVNVSKLVAPNYSGGYLLSYENDNIEAGAHQLEAGLSDWLRWQPQRGCATCGHGDVPPLGHASCGTCKPLRGPAACLSE